MRFTGFNFYSRYHRDPNHRQQQLRHHATTRPTRPCINTRSHNPPPTYREQNPPQSTIDAMVQAARDAGLSIYMDAWPGVFNVSQTDCAYDEADAEAAAVSRHLRG